jgi:hypothetical protein
MNFMIWADPGLIFSRFATCGIIYGSGIALTFPDILASFLGVSPRFIREHIAVRGMVEFRVAEGQSRLPAIRLFIRELNSIFPPRVLDCCRENV